jgi:hypothetical protein
MRISLSINGNPQYMAALSGAGYLSAHLNVRNRPKENHLSAVVRLDATDTSLKTENVSMDWPSIPLHAGDVVELKLLPPDEGDPPSETRRTSQYPRNLFAREENAAELVKIVSDFEARLMDLVSRFEQTEPPDEFAKLQRAVGSVVWELGVSFLYPVYRRHQHLMPDEMKGELL